MTQSPQTLAASAAAPEKAATRTDDPFLSSLMARGSAYRLAIAAGLIAILWAAILWAVSLP